MTHHGISSNVDQLLMYIGGMGGTGKSQVLKAISDFFSKQGESFRFLIVAPTGSAASLLGGSTYHSIFGINDMTETPTAKNISQVCSRLLGIDYIFFDENFHSICTCYV